MEKLKPPILCFLSLILIAFLPAQDYSKKDIPLTRNPLLASDNDTRIDVNNID